MHSEENFKTLCCIVLKVEGRWLENKKHFQLFAIKIDRLLSPSFWFCVHQYWMNSAHSKWFVTVFLNLLPSRRKSCCWHWWTLDFSATSFSTSIKPFWWDNFFKCFMLFNRWLFMWLVQCTLSIFACWFKVGDLWFQVGHLLTVRNQVGIHSLPDFPLVSLLTPQSLLMLRTSSAIKRCRNFDFGHINKVQ